LAAPAAAICLLIRVLADTPYSLKTRFENEKGTNM
jgi:hypothetical protein